MAKTILIPTDFKVESLNTLKLALTEVNDNEVNVILMHSELISDSITDLLFYFPKKNIMQHIKPEFEKALEILKNRFQNTLSKISIETFHGHILNSLETFLKMNQVEEIYIPKNYKLTEVDQIFDPVPLLKKASLPVHEIGWQPFATSGNNDGLESLFQ